MKRWSWVLVLGFFVLWLGLGVLVLLGVVLPHFERSDIAVLYRARALFSHHLPYFQLRIEYPVLLGWWMWATAWAPGFSGYLTANVLGLSAAAAAITVLLHRLRPAFYQWWTVFPLLFAFSFVNWDLLGILALMGAWDAWTRQRPAWTGVWLAVGTATKLFPVIAWPFMAYAWWRAGRRSHAARMTLWALFVWLILNAPEMVGAWRNWSWFWVFNFERSSSTDLFWLLHLNHTLGRRGIDGLSLLIVGGVTLWALRRMAAGWDAPAATAAVMTGFFIVTVSALLQPLAPVHPVGTAGTVRPPISVTSVSMHRCGFGLGQRQMHVFDGGSRRWKRRTAGGGVTNAAPRMNRESDKPGVGRSCRGD